MVIKSGGPTNRTDQLVVLFLAKLGYDKQPMTMLNIGIMGSVYTTGYVDQFIFVQVADLCWIVGTIFV